MACRVCSNDVLHLFFLFITYCAHVHVQKYDEGAVRNRIRKMTGIDSGEGIERRRSGWMDGG